MSCVIMASRQPVRGGHSSRVRIEIVIPWTLNCYPLDFESSPHVSFHVKVMDLWVEGAAEEGKTLG